MKQPRSIRPVQAVWAVILGVAFLAVCGWAAFNDISSSRISYASASPAATSGGALAEALASSTPIVPMKPVILHIPTPIPVRSVYMTACTASEAKLRDKVVSELAGTEINSVVIDLKDYSGTLSYASTTVATPPGGRGCRIIDLPEFVQELHDKGLYAIGRITVFQDPLYSRAHPELAVASRSHPGEPWTDRNGLAYIDPDHPAYWDYIVAIAEEGHSIGFDEINFDYIRFPSDGDMSDARFALSASTTKAAVIKGFFAYLRSQLDPPDGSSSIVMSADLFGQTTVAPDDMGIGQVLTNALPYFDYVAPMVYPSHFTDGFAGYAVPAEHPYGIIKYTMTTAVERAVAASSTPDELRPWLQAFDLGAIYTPDMVDAEKQAVYAAGLSGYMLWNAASQYNVPELMPAPLLPPPIEAAPVPTTAVASSKLASSSQPAIVK